MDLPLTVTPSGPTARGAALRSTQAYRELVCGKTTLEGGIAFHCDRFPAFPWENQFREVMLENPDAAAGILAGVEAFFAERDLRCRRFALAEAQRPEAIEPTLRAAGWVRDDRVAMVLAENPDLTAPAGIRVLPARPMRAAFRACWADWARFLPVEQQDAAVEVATERLDDHRLDAFVAMVEGKPAGAAALFQVGDIGRIDDFHVLGDFRDGEVAKALLAQVLTLARRLSLRIVVAAPLAREPATRSLLTCHGFAEAGPLVEYGRADDPRPEPLASW
jgi:GNAT superfamily N-acetyltransferase